MSTLTKILAIDTSMAACSVAVVLGQRVHTSSKPMDRGQAEALVPMMGELLKVANILPDELDAVAVTIGPGSFTGLRVGMSAAKGFGLAINRPVFGVTTFDVLADQALDCQPGKPLAVLIDSKRGDIYARFYKGQRDFNGLPEAVGDMGVILRDADLNGYALAGDATALIGSSNLSTVVIPDPVRLARLACVKQIPVPARPLYLRPADATPARNGGRLWE